MVETLKLVPGYSVILLGPMGCFRDSLRKLL